MKSANKQNKTKRRTWTSVIAIVLCVLLLGSLLTGALLTMVSAASSSEIQKEINSLKEKAQEIADEKAALEANLAANATETENVIAQKSAIDQRIHVTEAEIENANAQIQQYSLLIAEKQSELEDALARQAEMNETYKARLRAMEETGTISYWSILFKSSSFSDLLDRINMIREIAEADQLMLQQIEEMAGEIQEDREALEAEMDALEETKNSLAEMEATLLEQRAEADSLLLQLAEAEKTMSADYLANLQAEEEQMALIMAAQAEYEKALSAEEAARLAQANANNVAGSGSTSNVTPSTSGFVNPLSSITVTCAYGWRIHPLWGNESFHTGVDLAANSGAPIYAVASGTVTTATYNDAYGYCVEISHGNGYGSFYGHMTNYIVSSGDFVSQGQVIGYVGSTGWSTGPHLHFEIRINGSAVNPMEYIG